MKTARLSKIILSLLLVGILSTSFASFGAPQVALAAQTSQDFSRTFGFKTIYGSCSWYEVFCSITIWSREIVFAGLGLLQDFFGLALNAFSFLAVAMIKYGTHVINLPIVTSGFKITLGFTNLLFVFAIIIIAFATIFRIEEYSAKRLLRNLILAAILVNFSFLIAGLLLDASNVFTFFFIDKLSGETIGAGLQPQEILGANNAGFWERAGDGNKTWAKNKDQIMINQSDWDVFFDLVIKAVLVVGATFLFMCTMIAVTIMALVRNLWVAFLLILMPLTWALWVLPAFQEHHRSWWKNFMKWIVSLPTVTFFVWLAIETAQLTTSVEQIDYLGAGAVKAGALGPLFDGLLKALIICGLLIGGLMAARASGVAGAGIGLALAAGAKNKIVGAGKRVTGRGVRLAAQGTKATAKFAGKTALKATANLATIPIAAGGALGGIIRKGMGEGGQGAAEGKRFLGRTAFGKTMTRGAGRVLAGIPGLRSVGNSLMGAGDRQKEIDTYYEKNFSHLDASQRKAAYEAPPVSDVGKAAMLRLANEKHELDKIPNYHLPDAVEAVKRINPGTPPDKIELLKDVAALDPSMAPQITGKSVTETVSKATPADALKWTDHTLEKAGVAGSMSEAQIGRIYKEGSVEQKAALERGLRIGLAEGFNEIEASLGTTDRNTLEGSLKELERIATEVRDAKERGDMTKIQTLQAERKFYTGERDTVLAKHRAAAGEDSMVGSLSKNLLYYNSQIGTP